MFLPHDLGTYLSGINQEKTKMTSREPTADMTSIGINYKGIKTQLNIGEGVEVPALLPRVKVNHRQRLSLVAAQLSKFVDFVYFSLYALLAIQLLLVLFAKNSGNGFVRLIKNISNPFFSPFKGFFPSLTAELGIVLFLPLLIAIFFYMFLYLIINGLLTVLVNRETDF